MVVRHLLGWLLLALVAIVNGVLRETTYGHCTSDLGAHQVSTLTGILLTSLVAWWLARTWPLVSTTQAWLVGLAWLCMTVCFEFGFGHYLAGHSWQRLLADYNLFAGRVWLLFLAWIMLLPWLCFRCTHRTGTVTR